MLPSVRVKIYESLTKIVERFEVDKSKKFLTTGKMRQLNEDVATLAQALLAILPDPSTAEIWSEQPKS